MKPFSLIICIAIGVCLGQLAATGIQALIAMQLARQAMQQMSSEAAASREQADEARRQREEAKVRAELQARGPALPGPLESSLRVGDLACIAGTISRKEPNGWSQVTDSANRSQPCVQR